MGLPAIDHLDVWVEAASVGTGRGRGSSKRVMNVGANALRGLILEMAISGKLCPNEKEVTSIKDKVVADLGEKIGKKYKFTILPDEEQLKSIPDSWVWTNVKSIGHQLEQKKPDRTFTYIDVSSIESGSGRITEPKIVLSKNAPSRARKMVRAGTVIYSTVRPYLNNIAVIENNFEEEPIASTAFAIIHPSNHLNSRFIYYYLLSPTFVSYVESVQAGIAYPSINNKQFYNAPFPLPPTAEQKRIVEKVDELMGVIDDLETQTDIAHERRAELTDALLRALVESEGADALAQNWKTLIEHFDTLFTTEKCVEKLKATILDLAVRGKLSDTRPNEKAADLNLVKSERAKNNVKHRFQKTVTNIALPFDTPDNWHVEFLGNVMLKITDGTHHSPPNGESEEFLYISAKNIKSHGVLTSNATFVSQEIHDEIYSRCDPEFGDILYIKDGATTGIGTINDLIEPFSMLSSVALLKPSSITLNKFVLYLMRSPYFYDAMRAKMSGVAITRVTLKKLNEAVIPLPPYEEQKRIVNKVDELMALCDDLLKNIRDSEALKVELAESVVHHASAN